MNPAVYATALTNFPNILSHHVGTDAGAFAQSPFSVSAGLFLQYFQQRRDEHHSLFPSPAIPAPTIQLVIATAATGGQKMATGAQTTAYALNGNPSVDRINPKLSPPNRVSFNLQGRPGSCPSVNFQLHSNG